MFGRSFARPGFESQVFGWFRASSAQKSLGNGLELPLGRSFAVSILQFDGVDRNPTPRSSADFANLVVAPKCAFLGELDPPVYIGRDGGVPVIEPRADEEGLFEWSGYFAGRQRDGADEGQGHDCDKCLGDS